MTDTLRDRLERGHVLARLEKNRARRRAAAAELLAGRDEMLEILDLGVRLKMTQASLFAAIGIGRRRGHDVLHRIIDHRPRLYDDERGTK